MPSKAQKQSCIAWRESLARLIDAELACKNARDEAERLDAEHRAKYPLSSRAKSRILKLYRTGQPLCCAQGKENLSRCVDLVWVEHINTWAYGYLGCQDPEWRPGGRWHEKGAAKLLELGRLTEITRLHSTRQSNTGDLLEKERPPDFSSPHRDRHGQGGR